MRKVAVLMSTYNGEKYIRQQIDTILAQKGDFELDLYVRDDGSKDQTISILEEYKKKDKLQWYTGENLGPAKSFMDLLYIVKGYDFYVFADQDDVWLEDKIMSAINKIQDINGPVLYYSNAKLVDQDLNELTGYVYNGIQPKTDFHTLVCAGGLLGCTMVFNDVLAETVRKEKKPEYIVMHDYYLAIVCIGIGGQIIYDSNSYINYRQHGSNVVGVSYGIKGKIRNRLKRITKKTPVSISLQADDILKRYGEKCSVEYCEWLKKVSEYRNSIFKRISLGTSLKTSYINWNMSIVMRLAIIFGNR